MNCKQLDRWRKIREKGKVKYILQHGILYWGIPMGIFIVFFSTIKDDGIQYFSSWIIIAVHFIIGILYGLIIGTVYGSFSWRLNEKEWLKKIKY
ncbi:hypothetical protein [Alkaliphilus hydrothermalis]|uniref:Tetrahydromethanopterin S-methyltransferase subunit G n=1 Tax=Alkaliphilus hydrothermalis TaxID=1482730 RepID=A0ABS2NT74_9FIRM|nr:hypothetical protein [Alkaliphilus hydrothermalis]MBM7615962.1 tetrahydromethanopterin S-methyltransferase subunit G [Alkaliphilus hydrothermalis]